MSNRPDNITPRRPTCARHVVALLSRAQLLRIIISASQTIVRHREGYIVTNIAARRITRSGHTGIAARSLHQASIDHVTSYDLHRHGRTVASSSRCPSRRTTSTPRLTHLLTDLLRLLAWTGGFVIPSSTYFGDFGVTSRPASSH